jgi:hypothetical protein
VSEHYPCYSTIRIRIAAAALNEDGSKTPYSGAVTVYYLRANNSTVLYQTVMCTAGVGIFSVYVDVPGTWKYCIRKDGDPRGESLDKSFEIDPTFAPEVL